MTLNEILKTATIICVEDGNWVVAGEKHEGGGTNFGNFKTSEQAKCVADFINSAIANKLSVDSIQHLSEAFEYLAGRSK